MNKKHIKGWLKHGDFIIIDIIIMQLSFVFSFWIKNTGISNPYKTNEYKGQAVILFLCQILVILFANNYEGILRRKRFGEFMAICRYMLGILLALLTYLFVVHQSSDFSRLMTGLICIFFVMLDYGARYLNKKRIFSSGNDTRGKSSMVLITSKDLVDDALSKLNDDKIIRNYFVSGVILMDCDDTSEYKDRDITFLPLDDNSLSAITHGWIDEVFILQPDYMAFPADLMDKLMDMGMTVNYTNSAVINDKWPVTDLRKLGHYKVLTTGVKFATAGQLFAKRCLDIVGSIFGLILTGLICLFVGPMIYMKSPGPIFFSQERIGRNGKKFKMYKFRSMYLDAEERKKELMEQNKIKDGMMFKMDDDPRIIGSEKKDKNGNPKGIGNFIRKTSIDELPQFLNVLKGDMSLVGTRPPTLDEWEKYDYAHRIRMSIKPGLTGLWQVSGRSEITDFDEVVKLDREYIEDWSLELDLIIIIKTVLVVVKGKGAE